MGVTGLIPARAWAAEAACRACGGHAGIRPVATPPPFGRRLARHRPKGEAPRPMISRPSG